MCRKSFKARPARQRRSKKVFCSPPCYHQSMINTKRPPKVCKMISLHHSRHNLGKKHSPELIKRMSEARKGKYTGECHHMHRFPRFGKKAIHWKGGEYITRGRKFIYYFNHPYLSNNRRHIPYSRFLAEKVIGRYLNSKEIVHHIDFNPRNDIPENLYLFPNQSEHAKFHNLLRKNPNLTLTSNLF